MFRKNYFLIIFILLSSITIFCQESIEFVDEFDGEKNITKKGIHEWIRNIYPLEKGNVLIYGERGNRGDRTVFIKKIDKYGEIVNEKEFPKNSFYSLYIDDKYNSWLLFQKKEKGKIFINLIKLDNAFNRVLETGYKINTGQRYEHQLRGFNYSILSNNKLTYFFRGTEDKKCLATKINKKGGIILEKNFNANLFLRNKTSVFSKNNIKYSNNFFSLPFIFKDSIKILKIDDQFNVLDTTVITTNKFISNFKQDKIIAKAKYSGSDRNDIYVEKFDKEGVSKWKFYPPSVKDEKAWSYLSFERGYLILCNREKSIFYLTLDRNGKLVGKERNIFTERNGNNSKIIKTSDNSFVYGSQKNGKNGRMNIFLRRFNFNGNIPPPPTQPDTWAISIGVTDYKNNRRFSRLKYSRRYANDFAENLEDIQLVDRTLVLNDEDASYSAILDSMKSIFLSPKVKKEDYIILFFSGHGKMTGNGKVGICPYDYTDVEHLISDEQIIEILKQSPAKHKAVFLEACRNINDPVGVVQGGNPKLDDDKIKEFNKERHRIKDGIIFITSTKIGEYSWEYPIRDDSEIRGGLFSFFLMKGIKGEANNHVIDNIITAQELFEYIYDNVTVKSNFQQIPQKNEELDHSVDTPLFIIPEEKN